MHSHSILLHDRYVRVLNMKLDKIPTDAVRIDRRSKWGNPFVIGRDGTRDEVCDKYEAWFETSGLAAFLHEIRGRDLVCWCAPARCHGCFLLRRANLSCVETS